MTTKSFLFLSFIILDTFICTHAPSGCLNCPSVLAQFLQSPTEQPIGPTKCLTNRGVDCLAGSAQQYMGQDEFYGEQYGHTQSSSEPINQQYYPDGNHAHP